MAAAHSSSIDPRLRRDTDPSMRSVHQPPQLQQRPQYISTHDHDQNQAHNVPPNLFDPESPHPGAGLDQEGGFDGQDSPQSDIKRTRACEACRGLKVKCELDPNSPTGNCKRCAKAGRSCLVTAPSRKRQKKTDSRVAELEKKIDTLTASLHATKSGSESTSRVEVDNLFATPARQNAYRQVTNGANRSPYTTHPVPLGNNWTENHTVSESKGLAPMVVAGQKRKQMESKTISATLDLPNQNIQHQNVLASRNASLDTAPLTDMLLSGPKPLQSHQYQDVVDRGIVKTDQAVVMFNCYVENMAPHMPAVVFNHHTTAAEVRKTKPVLFLAILSASSGMNYPKLQPILTKEVMRIYADRIICNGEKSLELIQALHVSTIWYWPPEQFEELKFYQLIHIAAVMALDIGMGKKSKSIRSKDAGLFRDRSWRKTPYPDSESLEARRAWLACYYLCCNASMGLRRPNLIRWSSFIEDCVQVLESSLDAAPTDKSLCHWIRSQHIAEEVGTRFSMDDPSTTVNVSNPGVQHALKGFEKDLENWRNMLTPEAQSPFLKLSEHCVNLYMHEVAMHVDHNTDVSKTSIANEGLRVQESRSSAEILGIAQVTALSTCLTSIDGVFEVFLNFDVDTIRCLPVACLVRVAYAVVVLIKMYFAAAAPNSELGKVIDRENMKVEYYLDGLVEKLKACATEEKSRPSAKFLMVLFMLKTWFHGQGELKPTNSSNEATAKPTNSLIPASDIKARQSNRKPSYSPVNTPLQMLSEVATNNSSGQPPTPDHQSESFGAANERQHQPFQGYDSIKQMQIPPTYMGGNADGSFGMDFDYMMGDGGLEQVMGFTLGAGFGDYDLGSFYTEFMDPLGPNPELDGL